jgi:hypothetical protein
MDGKLFKTTYQQRKEYSKDMKINKNKTCKNKTKKKTNNAKKGIKVRTLILELLYQKKGIYATITVL